MADYPVQKTDEEWRKILTPEQYQILRHHATERPGSCALNTEKRAGTFYCAFPYYQPDELNGFYRHAHCDWLQAAGELGLAGLLLLAAAVGSALSGFP